MHRSFYVPQAAQGPVPCGVTEKELREQIPAAADPAQAIQQSAQQSAGPEQAKETLAEAARQVAAPAPRQLVQPSWPELEFHAEAGAPEGALYVNGEYVGRLDVNRL